MFTSRNFGLRNALSNLESHFETFLNLTHHGNSNSNQRQNPIRRISQLLNGGFAGLRLRRRSHIKF